MLLFPYMDVAHADVSCIFVALHNSWYSAVIVFLCCGVYFVQSQLLL